MMQASIALSALLLTKAHGFSIAPFGNPRICRIHPLSVADAVSSDMDIEDVVALLEDPDDLNALLQEDNLLQDAIEALENDGVPVGEDVAAGDEDIDVVAEFLAMVKETPPGSMDNDEVALLRTVMQGLLIENDASDSAQTAQQIETLLFRMLDEYDGAAQTRDRERMKLSAPTSDDFALASQAWLESDDKEGKNRAISVFLEQEQFYKAHNLCKPTVDNIHTVLNALAESRSRDSDKKAWSIVQNLDEFDLAPTAQMHAALIAALARSRQRGSAQRAENALNDALEKFPPMLDDEGNNLGMTVDSFNVVLTGWAKCGQDDGPDRAGQLLMRMEEADQQQGILKPTASSFTSLIDAYTQLKTWESACQAERTLNALLDFYLDDQDPILEPTIATWGIVLSSWYRLSKKGSSDAASKAHNLLIRMEALYEDGKLSYGPDAIAYVTCMNAWALCKDPEKESGKHAEALLDEMNERYMDGDDTFKPSPKSVRAIVDAWIKSTDPEALERAEAFLDRYEDMEYLSDPDDKPILRDIFKSLIFGWCKQGKPDRADEFLLAMVDQDLEPDSFCFDKVIESYTEDGGRLDKVKKVFAVMQEASDAGGVKPNERVYTSFIRALTKAGVPNLAEEASAILKLMHAEYEGGNKGIKPTVFTYNAVLKACSTCLSEDTASNLSTFKVALSIFNELRAANEEPDHVTFGNMLRCAALLPQGPQREAMITTTFQLCCKNGFLNSFVIRDLQFAAEEELWRELCSCRAGEVDLDRLPQDWVTRFEKKERKPPPRRRKRF